jgi:hypothetical protein
MSLGRASVSLCLLGVSATLACCGGGSSLPQAHNGVDLGLVNKFKLNAPQGTVLAAFKTAPLRMRTAVGTPDRGHPHRHATYTCYAYRVLHRAPTDYVEVCFALNKLQSVFSAVGEPPIG